ncbi:MAG: hypothetical protein HY298_00585 [Verrucomicrobia bacterium]|nr:hypothetical protein [Verrucomicrobiota bacterium]
MSSSTDTDIDLELHFLPAWAQVSPDSNRYARHAGDDGRPERGYDDRPGRRPARREPAGRDSNRGARADRGRSPRRDGGFPQGAGQRGFRRDEPREQREPAPLPEIKVTLLPDDKGVESLARQIRMTGRAYPLFQIAKMILQKPERQLVRFSVIKKADGTVAQSLFVCALDDTLWLSEDEAVAHVLNKHFATFYQAEKTATEPPKGTYTFVAQCGMSGVILGPPNYHDYQNQLRKLHAERFARIPFEAFKSRVRIVKDEAVVKKWVEDQSFRTEYVCLNVPEPLKLPSREAVEKHFRETHLANIIKPVESHTLSGTASRALPLPALARLLRHTWEEQRRFPLQTATILSQQFAAHGLQFFKVNRTVTHVSVARPHFLDVEATPVSEEIKRIVDFVNATPKCTRRRLMEALAPASASSDSESRPSAEGATPDVVAAAEPTPEMTAVITNLHWLIHQGHVIEFANGILETAKKPALKPPKPEQKPDETPTAPPGQVASVESSTALQQQAAEIEPAPVIPATEAIPEAVADLTAALPAVETDAQKAAEIVEEKQTPVANETA